MHERALRIVYKNYNSSFDQLPEKDNSCKIHDGNIKKLVTEILHLKMNLAPEIMKEVFEIVEGPYPLKNQLKLKSRKIHYVRYCIESTSFATARFWKSLPSDPKECKSHELFKSKIRNWIPENCLCKLCKTYLYRIDICFFKTIRFRSGSTCPVNPEVWVFKAIVNDWQLLTI